MSEVILTRRALRARRDLESSIPPIPGAIVDDPAWLRPSTTASNPWERISAAGSSAEPATVPALSVPSSPAVNAWLAGAQARPVTQIPVAQAPVTQPPVAQIPVTQAPITQAPITQAPVAQAPVAPPATTAPAASVTPNSSDGQRVRSLADIVSSAASAGWTRSAGLPAVTGVATTHSEPDGRRAAAEPATSTPAPAHPAVTALQSAAEPATRAPAPAAATPTALQPAPEPAVLATAPARSTPTDLQAQPATPAFAPAAARPITTSAPSGPPVRNGRKTAAQPVPRRDDPAGDTADVARPRIDAWRTIANDVLGVNSRGGRKAWTRSLQALLAAAAIVTLVVGVRSVLAPAPASDTPSAVTYPQATAAAVAERFGSAYFTWDEDAPDAHAAGLSGTMQTGIPRDAGWDGSGKSDGGPATATGVSIASATDAVVTVVVPVTPYTGGPGSWRAGTLTQMALSVPVTAVGTGVFVSGLPASVGVPKPTAADTTPVTVDTRTTTATSRAVTTFFSSLGRDRSVSMSASGEAATGLAGSLQYRSLLTWSVEQSKGAPKVGYATVRWATASGAALEQRYRVVLKRDDTGTWQVRSITSAVPITR